MFAFIEATAATTAKSTPQIDSDGFTLDNRRRKRAQKTRQHFNYSALSIAGEDSPICDIERSIALVRQRIKLARFDTIINTVLQHAMELPISQMVVYGLGRCSKSGDSLIQLEFCALLLSRLPAAQSQAFVYDPQMSAGDYKMAAEFGFQRITENECGRRSVVRRPTLFFMPRCPLGLYDNLLEANYTANSLNNCLIVGNDFQSYTIRHSRSKLNRLAPYLAASVDLAHIERLKISDADDKDIQMSLNDLAIHRWTLPSSCSGTEFQLPAVDNAVKERDNELLGDPQH